MENRETNNAEMTPQQLDRLFDLFLACREMNAEVRSVWLREECKGDLSLERSVEQLIHEDASAEGFLSRPMNLLTRDFSFVISEGQRIGRYTITGFVGRGGMGEVWKAHDEELDRAVALKFMNLGLPVNQLTREARMASALNHPGIVTVYDVIVWEETPILVMELVTGSPLSRFCNGLMAVDQVVSVAAQVSSALAAAHTAGIVHGDLKPDNIIWRDDRLAKILDFGLARKIANAAAGMQAGTPLYMSPEQARGEAAGTPSDVYSLGLVLFELATGQRPFGRQSLKEIGARRDMPRKASGMRHAKLHHLIARMLEPDPAKRIGMQEAAEQLHSFGRPSTLRRVWKIAALSASLTLAVMVLVWLWAHPRRQIDFARLTIRPLASQPGLEDNPSISPDGLWISCLYRARAADRPLLQVHSMQGGPPVAIETGALVVQGPAAWAPDSSELIFSAMEGSREHSIYRVRRTGGAASRIAGCRPRTDGLCDVDWSPDGTTLAITGQWPDNSELYLLDLASGQRRALIPSDRQALSRPRFSPDGKKIAYLQQASQNSMTRDDLYIVPAAGGAPRRITRSPWFLKGFAWSTDGKSLLAFSSRESDKPQIWQFPLDSSAPYRVGELDAGRGGQPTLSRGKGSLAWVRDLSVNSLWRMPVDRVTDQAEPLVNSAAVDIDAEWSSNGRMVFRSDRSGVNELWIAKADGSGSWQATWLRGPFVGDPHWSPDGRAIAFTAHKDGNPDIFVIRCAPDAGACGEARQLTRSPATDANPTWSVDGRWIYFSSSRSGHYEVWRMLSAAGAEPERVTWNGGYMARESADGKWLYYSKVGQLVSFWRIPLPSRGPGQPETPVAPNTPYKTGATWALGEHELFYYPSIDNPAVPFPAVRAVDLETRGTRDLPVGNVRLGRGLSLSPDGHWLLRSQIDRAQTLVMIAE